MMQFDAHYAAILEGLNMRTIKRKGNKGNSR